jgi:hypothetical protein
MDKSSVGDVGLPEGVIQPARKATGGVTLIEGIFYGDGTRGGGG